MSSKKVEAPNYKHLPSPKRLAFAEALAQNGYAQAGQITNEFQWPNFQKNDFTDYQKRFHRFLKNLRNFAF